MSRLLVVVRHRLCHAMIHIEWRRKRSSDKGDYDALLNVLNHSQQPSLIIFIVISIVAKRQKKQQKSSYKKEREARFKQHRLKSAKSAEVKWKVCRDPHLSRHSSYISPCSLFALVYFLCEPTREMKLRVLFPVCLLRESIQASFVCKRDLLERKSRMCVVVDICITSNILKREEKKETNSSKSTWCWFDEVGTLYFRIDILFFACLFGEEEKKINFNLVFSVSRRSYHVSRIDRSLLFSFCFT